ncbi:MAG TPA: copper transporter [Solirubrobacteraceae bacterium]|jgi:hypothetical protein
MFDYRYHALSLAAVLLALAVGVLIGVAIGDSNLVSSAKSGVVHDLRSEVSGANSQADHLRSQLANEEALGNDLYQIAVHGLLSGRRVGLVFLGTPSDQIDGLVRDAITQAGGDLVTVVTVREPLDLPGLAREAAGTPYAALATQPRLVSRFGVRIARQLVGSNHALLGKVQARLLSSFDGQLEGLDGLVVVRSEPEGMTPEQAKTAGEFEAGLIEGATTGGVATVGGELSSTSPSQISWYKSKDISSVDDLDTPAGRAALVFTLTGAHGSYGEKPSADSGLLPRVAGGTSLP